MAERKIKEVRQMLAQAGLDELDEVTVARLAKELEHAQSPEDNVRAMMRALGAGEIDEQTLQQIAELARSSGSQQEFVDAIFVGPCPGCGNEKTRSAEEEPGIEDPTVGMCPACKLVWCTECGSRLTRERPLCVNPECWLNQDDEEGGDEDGEDEPEL